MVCAAVALGFLHKSFLLSSWEKAVLELKAISGVAGKIADSVRSSLFISLLTPGNESAENHTRCVRAAVLAEVSVYVEKAGHWSTLLLHVSFHHIHGRRIFVLKFCSTGALKILL